MQTSKKKKKEEKVDFGTIKTQVEAARKTHKAWYDGEKGQARAAYEYRETIGQVPKGFPNKAKIFLPVNLIKESHDHRMGLYLGADPEWTVRGRGKDFKDRKRTKLIKAVMEFMGEEANLEEAIEWVLDDYGLPGMGCVRTRWSPHTPTSMDTLGRVMLDYMPLKGIRLDPRALHPDRGRFVCYEKDVNRKEFAEEWGDYYYNKFNKKLDVDKIFRVATKDGGIDYDKNLNTDEDKKVISIIQYEYWRKLKILLKHPETKETIKDDNGKEVYIPKKEHRIAIAAGDQIFNDIKSPLSNLGIWTMIFFYNSRIHDMPFSQSDFPRQRHIQDAINTFLSLMLQAQAKDIFRKRLIMKGSIEDMDQLKESSDVDYVEWDPESVSPGMNPEAAIPRLEEASSINMGAFNLLGLLFQKFENVSEKDVLKGKAPPQVKSGKAIGLLQGMGMQPYNYQRKKINQGFRKLGMAMWELTRENLPDDLELPTTNEDGESQGLYVNKIVSLGTVSRMVESMRLGQNLEPDDQLSNVFPGMGELGRVKEYYEMITIRDGDDHITINDFAKEHGVRAEELLSATNEDIRRKLDNIDFVYNDINFGNFAVGLTVDPLAEQSRMEKMARMEMVLPMMEKLQAPMAAFEHVLKVLEIPDRAEILKKVKEESQAWQTLNQMMEQGGGQGAQK